MNQTCLPIEIDCLLPEKHIVYQIDDMIESIPEESIKLFELSDGRPAYHPQLHLKVLLYAYSEKTYSGRDFQKMMQENLAMVWISGHQIVSYRTNWLYNSEEETITLLDGTCYFFDRDQRRKTKMGITKRFVSINPRSQKLRHKRLLILITMTNNSNKQHGRRFYLSKINGFTHNVRLMWNLFLVR